MMQLMQESRRLHGACRQYDSMPRESCHNSVMTPRGCALQVRVPEDNVADLLRRLCCDDMRWADAQQKYPAQAAPSE